MISEINNSILSNLNESVDTKKAKRKSLTEARRNPENNNKVAPRKYNDYAYVDKDMENQLSNSKKVNVNSNGRALYRRDDVESGMYGDTKDMRDYKIKKHGANAAKNVGSKRLANKLNKEASAIVANKRKQRTKETIDEAPVCDLPTRYDSRNSFYGKARVDTGKEDNENKLYSYDTLVAEMVDGKPVVYGTYSATTLRHIKEWLKQNGFKAENSKQIMVDYGPKNESALKEEVNNEAYEIADIIAKEIEEKGIMNFTEIEDRIEELLPNYPSLKAKLDNGEEDFSELSIDIRIILNYNGIDNNFGNGDFYTQEYAKNHPEVLEESVKSITDDKKLNEASSDLDEVSKEYEEAYGEPLDLNKVDCIIAIDKFLSGWGGAEGRNHYQVILCKDSVEAANLESKIKRNPDGLSRIRRAFSAKVPRGASVSYIIGKNATAWN